MATTPHGFVPIRTNDDDLTKVQDRILAAFDKLASGITPAAAWQGVTVNTHAQLRMIKGDPNGIGGPRAAIVGGNVLAVDGGQGVFVWDPGSTAADDDSTVIQSSQTTVGRWRKI